MVVIVALVLAAIAVLAAVIGAALFSLGALAMSHTASAPARVGGAAPKCELRDFTKADAAALGKIAGDADTMRFVGNGRPWDAAKVERFLGWTLAEQKAPLYWGIEVAGALVGVVGVHPAPYRDGSTAGRDFVTIFIAKGQTGRGCGAAALRDALGRRWARTRRPAYADIRPENEASVRLHKKLGFLPVGAVDIRGVRNTRYRADGPAPAPPTPVNRSFLVLGKQLSEKLLGAMFQAVGWTPVAEEVAIKTGAVGILALEGASSWNKSLRDVTSVVKSRLDAEVLTNKVLLHDRLDGAGVTPETVVVPAGRKGFVPAVPPGEVWIWRPEGGFAGRGIKVVEGTRALYAVAKAHARRSPRNRALVSRYLARPKLTADGRKFHLRLYLVVAVVPEGVKGMRAGRHAVLCREGDIAVAKDKFLADQYHVKDIHDTHVSTGGGLRFPAEYPGGAEAGAAARAAIAEQMLAFLPGLLPEVVPFAESFGGYEIYGVDYMVDADDRPWLIEINSRPGYALTPDGIGEERQAWITAMLADAVSHVLFGTETAAIPVAS